MNQKKNNTGKGILCLLGLLIVIAVCGFFAAGTLQKSKLVTDENGAEVSLRGESIGGGNAVITKLNGVDVELTGNYNTLVIEQIDKKGVLAFLTAILSANEINIATLRLFREGKGKKATTIIEVDSEASNQVVATLYGLEAVKNVIVVPRIKMD